MASMTLGRTLSPIVSRINLVAHKLSADLKTIGALRDRLQEQSLIHGKNPVLGGMQLIVGTRVLKILCDRTCRFIRDRRKVCVNDEK